MKNRLSFISLIVVLLPSLLFAESQSIEIKVRMDERSISPTDPTINLRTSDPVVLVHILGVDQKEFTGMASYPDMTLYTRHDDHPAVLVRTSYSTDRSIVGVSFRECSAEAFAREGIQEVESVAGPINLLTIDQDLLSNYCPLAVLDPTRAGWTIFGRQRTVLFAVEAWKGATRDESDEVMSMVVPIFVRDQPWALRWSAGFSMFSRRDHRFRLAAIEGEEALRPVGVSDGSYPYQLAAFAHYHPLKGDWFAVSAGLASDVPVEELSIMLGVSLALRTLPLANSLYITTGVSYSRAGRLQPKFEGVQSVGSDIGTDELVINEYGFGGFIALSFGFAGGQDKFKGVVSGSKAEQ